VKGLQWDDAEGRTPTTPPTAAAGYGSKGRPDLSNTAFMIEALRSVGTSQNDPAIQRATGLRLAQHKISKGRTTRCRIPPRIPTAASTTRPPTAAKARRARSPTAACEATAR